jgi:hypothetical protein
MSLWSAVCLLGIAFSAGPALAAPDDFSSRADSALIAFVTPNYFHGLPYQKAHAFGPRAIPTLERLLHDDAYKSQWRNIVLTIGFIGDRRSFEILRAFTWDRFRGEIDQATLNAIMEVPSAMGCIPAVQKSSGAVPYLERGTDPRVWARLPWTQKRLSVDDLAFILSKRCFSGLSWTGTRETDRFLTELSAKPYDPQLRASVNDAIRRNREISKVGLSAYIESWRKKREQR